MNSQEDGAQYGRVLRNEDAEELPRVGRVRLPASLSAGAYEVLEFTYPGSAVPPPHIHRERDEVFYIAHGSLEFILGRQTVQADGGSLVHIPRGTRHGFTPADGSRILVFTFPAGLEGFFRALSEGMASGRSPAEIRAVLAGQFDSTPVE